MNDVSKYFRPATMPEVSDAKKRARVYPVSTRRFVWIDEQWSIRAIQAGINKSYGAVGVGLLLWQQYRLNHERQPLKLTTRMREKFGIKRRLMDSGLVALEEAGLITVQRFKHRSPRITLVTNKKDLEADGGEN